MVFDLKRRSVFFFEIQFEKKGSLGSRFDRMRVEENRVWFSYPSACLEALGHPLPCSYGGFFEMEYMEETGAD